MNLYFHLGARKKIAHRANIKEQWKKEYFADILSHSAKSMNIFIVPLGSRMLLLYCGSIHWAMRRPKIYLRFIF